MGKPICYYWESQAFTENERASSYSFIITAKEGTIMCAHCIGCMAGLRMLQDCYFMQKSGQDSMESSLALK